MAGNQPLQDKMAGNSLDHAPDEPSRGDITREELEQAYHRNLQKMKSLDTHPKKKGSFQITSVVIAKSGPTTEDGDSLDDLDETHTEDVSSDILDLSKTTDIEPDPSSTEEATTPSIAPDEVPSPKGLPKPPELEVEGKGNEKIDMSSRFKVVKIESKEPFKRGRWICLDFLDPPTEKAGEKGEEAGSGNSSAASSIHYIHGVDDPSKNPLGGTIVQVGGHPILEPQPIHPTSLHGQLPNGDYNASSMQAQATVPPVGPQTGSISGQDNNGSIQTAPGQSHSQITTHQPQSVSSQPTATSQVVTNKGGVAMVAQPPPPAVISHVQGQSQSQIHQSMPLNQGAPVATPKTSVSQLNENVSLQQGHTVLPSENSSEYVAQGKEYLPPLQKGGDFNAAHQATPPLDDFNSPTQINQGTAAIAKPLQVQQPVSVASGVEYNGSSQSHTGSIAGQSVLNISQNSSTNDFTGQTVTPSNVGVSVPTSLPSAPSNNTSPINENVQGSDLVIKDRGTSAFTSVGDVSDKSQARLDNVTAETADGEEPETATARRNSFQLPAHTHSLLTGVTPPLLEMVSATMQPGAGASKEDGDERSLLNVFSGASTVAIDNKIEQAMDLVKSHLMFAVREEVEVLKEQIKELLEKNNQLEYENSILKAAASPETLAQLSQSKSQPPSSNS